jgi:hypothetical protein
MPGELKFIPECTGSVSGRRSPCWISCCISPLMQSGVGAITDTGSIEERRFFWDPYTSVERSGNKAVTCTNA